MKTNSLLVLISYNVIIFNYLLNKLVNTALPFARSLPAMLAAELVIYSVIISNREYDKNSLS